MNSRQTLSAVAAIAFCFAAPVFADQASRDAKRAADAQYDATVDKAKADYKVAKERCDSLSGNEKDVCQKEAKARYTKAKADAKAAKKTTNVVASASEDKREANYKVAKERCDALSGNAKDVCLQEAKARYGQ